MFCPKCGNPDQSPETYCRQCGTFLPDLSKPLKKNQTPEEHIKVNTFLSSMTIFVCFALAALLYLILGFRPETHWLIYMTAGLLLAMGAWHIQTLWRILLLKKHFKKKNPTHENELTATTATGNLLVHPDFTNIVPPTVTEHTTKHLAEKKPRST